MKRNMELIKEILIFIEEHCDGKHLVSTDKAGFKETDNDIILEHCRLITERKLAISRQTEEGYLFDMLTWDGHDFLDNARNSEVWNATKKAAGKLSFGVFQKVLESTATSYALSLIKGAF